MNITWDEYVNHIFCLEYLPDNRFDHMKRTLSDINININDSKFFSFIYDFEHKIFEKQYNDMRDISFKFFNEYSLYESAHLNIEQHGYYFYVGLTTYRTLKIAQYFGYERIIIFEDDIVFLKDLDYIKKALDFLKTQEFDICSCQNSFMGARGGKKTNLINIGCEDLGNDMFLRTSKPIGLYGGAFMILTKNGINKIVKYFEDNNLMVSLDVLDYLRDLIELDTLFALKPLCVQQDLLSWHKEHIKLININLNIDEYI